METSTLDESQVEEETRLSYEGEIFFQLFDKVLKFVLKNKSNLSTPFPPRWPQKNSPNAFSNALKRPQRRRLTGFDAVSRYVYQLFDCFTLKTVN